MLLPAEIESKTLIPALRAILAKKLADDHNVREEEISKMLGVTQAAISNYIRGTRGDPALITKLLSEPEVSNLINELTENLSSDIAMEELEQRVIPITIRRVLPNGDFQNIPIDYFD